MGKMSYKTLTWLFVALVCGTIAAFVVRQLFFSASSKSNEVSLENPQRVLVANVDLKAGTELSAQNVRFDLVSEDKVPRDAIYSFDGVSGRKVVNDINESSPIRNLYDLEFVEKKEIEPSEYKPPGYAVVPLQIESVVGTSDQRNIADLIPLNKVLTKDDRVDLHIVLEESASDGLDRLKNSHLSLVDKLLVENVVVDNVLSEKRFSKESGVAERFSVVSLLLKEEERNLIEEQASLGKLRLVLKKTNESLPPATGDSGSGVLNSPSVSPNALLPEGTDGFAVEPSNNNSILANEFQFQNQRNNFPSDSSLESKNDVQTLENDSVDSVSESDVSVAPSDEKSGNESPELVISGDFSPPVNDDFLNESISSDADDLIRPSGEATQNVPTNGSEAKGINELKSVVSDFSSVKASLPEETPSSPNSDADDNVRRYYRQFQTKANQVSNSPFDVSVSRPKFSFPLKSNPNAAQTEISSASQSRTPASSTDSANSSSQVERRSDSETPVSTPTFRPRVQMQNQLSQAPK